ncbi:doublecortin domain-containing protein 1-like [Liolophura sinensis]|uniref:doublecortin domain-containing protein 1-like n=1 Tax=Liolophura sinensis TaxID=3198878 RepID=UPI00315812B9
MTSSNYRVTGRPPQAVRIDSTQDASFRYNRAASDMVSYEDLLVAQYLEELRRTKTESPRREHDPSPYSLRVVPTNNQQFNNSRKGRRQRPRSAQVHTRPQTAMRVKPKIDAKFIADPNLWDPATPREEPIKKIRMRPASAPVHRVRPWSGNSWAKLSLRPESGRRSKALYKQQPHTIVVTAYKNGSRDSPVKVAAANMKMLLEICTDKLRLGFAARRVFLEDGIEIFTASDIPRGGEIYISTGENYKCPYTTARRNTILKHGAAWTMSGVVLPDYGKKKKTRTCLSKRMRALLDNKKVRVMVFRNGKSTEAVEVVTDLTNMTEFLTGCTQRLDLRSHARILYDWTGTKITELTETPVVDSCLQPGGAPIFGPVWVSTGEGFDPKGAYDYSIYLKKYVKKKVKETKTYKSNLVYAKDGEKERVTIPSILTLSEEEVYEALEMADGEVEELEVVLETLDANIEQLEPRIREQEDIGNEYTMKHIKELKANDRLVGSQGLKLKVYENGQSENPQVFYFNLREAVKGIKNDIDKILERLLDELSASHRTMNPQNPKIKTLARALYDEQGNEITDVRKLEYGQEVWLSFGEPFIIPFTYCLQVQFGLVEGYELDDGRQVVMAKFVDRNDRPLAGKENPAEWETCEHFPAEYDYKEAKSPAETSYIQTLLEDQELDPGTQFLRHKKDQKLVVFPELAASRKVPGERSDKNGFMLDCSWQAESQIFMVSKSGYIYCKSVPKLCLGVSEFRVEVKQGEEGESSGETPADAEESHLEGIPVLIQGKLADRSSQQWIFHTDGTISSAAYPDLCLTYLGGKSQAHMDYMSGNRRIQGMKPGNKVVLILTDRMPAKDNECQRFALKQERFETIGQWKHTDVANPEWKKLAYSWPVRQDGQINEEYLWPMESFLMVSAPNPSKKVEKKTNLSGATPLRLAVLRNGERDKQKAVLVVGPNVSNWVSSPSNRRKSLTNTVDLDMSLHCQNLSVRELEFYMVRLFSAPVLDNCTELLDLPFAARRLFDEKGKEHFNLQDLSRDQFVHVTCGEAWSDPTVTKAEQQRRFLLSQLSQDVSQIRQFCALRNPEGFSLEVESLNVHAQVIINKQWHHDLEKTESDPEAVMESFNNRHELQLDLDSEDNMTAHERAHKRSEDRLNQLKWPWERLINAGGDFESDDPVAEQYTDKQMYEKFKPKLSPRQPRSTLQKFDFQDGFISCASNPDLVVGVADLDGQTNQVVLVKRRPDDVHQRWVIKDDGIIHSKYNQQLVLTVSLPHCSPSDSDGTSPISLVGSQVTLQRRQTSQYGRANQLWRYDAESGFISAFAANELDKEITAANKVDVCTYTVAGFSSLNQPGYVVLVPAPVNSDKETQAIRVCTSCARAMRGRCKVEKLTAQSSFSCAMGQAKKMKLKQIGSFKVLNGKVDLSRHEAERTLQIWEEVLENLKNEMNVKRIAREISAAKTVRPVRILAYKNGEGRLNSGEVIIGSSIDGMLNQCTQRLGMCNAATRLYTEDGTLILDMEDLVGWAVENYKSAMLTQVDRLLHKQEGSASQGQADVKEEKAIRAWGDGHANSTLEGETEKDNLMTDAGDGDKTDTDGQTQEKQTKSELNVDTDALLSQVPLPSLDVILRYPIEVWASSGKPFVSPDVLESQAETRKKQRQFRSAVSLELDIEKHILRQMKGRRFGEQKPGQYKGTRDSQKPVVLEGHWQEADVEEQVKHDTVNKLESHLAEVRANQKGGNTRVVNVNTSRRLYKQPNMKRVLVFPNGETVDKGVFVRGEDLEQLLEQAKLKLSPWKKFRCFFTVEGKLVKSFEEVEKDQVLCVSTGRTFKQPPVTRQDVEVKANWSRARKQYGPSATDYKVDTAQNPQVNVDPFGPPELALQGPIQTPGPALMARPPRTATPVS